MKMAYLFVSLLFLLDIFVICVSEDVPDDYVIGSGLVEATQFSEITASSTCGSQSSKSCKIFDPRDPESEVNCFWCRASHPRLSRPVQSVIDNSSSWWQSENMKEEVTITFKFFQKFVFTKMYVEPGLQQFPSFWSLEKSDDGKTYQSVKSFTTHDRGCFPRTSRCIIGTERYIEDNFVDYRYQVKAVFLRLRFQKFPTFKNIPKSVNDPTTLYFYTLRAVRFYGYCSCPSVENTCVRCGITKSVQCTCPDRSKCGYKCGECCPGYKTYHIPHGFLCYPCSCWNSTTTTPPPTTTTTTPPPPPTTTTTISTTTTTPTTTQTTTVWTPPLCDCTTTTTTTPPTTTTTPPTTTRTTSTTTTTPTTTQTTTVWTPPHCDCTTTTTTPPPTTTTTTPPPPPPPPTTTTTTLTTTQTTTVWTPPLCDCTTTTTTTPPTTTTTPPPPPSPPTTTPTTTTTECPCRKSTSTTTTPVTTSTTEPPTTTRCPCEQITTSTTPTPCPCQKTTSALIFTTKKSTRTKPPKLPTHNWKKAADVCTKRMLRSLENGGLQLNDWICTINSALKYPVAERLPIFLRNIEYNTQVLSETLDRMPSNGYMREKSNAIIPHITVMERYMDSLSDRVDQNIRKSEQNTMAHEDFLYTRDEIWEIENHVKQAIEPVHAMADAASPSLDEAHLDEEKKIANANLLLQEIKEVKFDSTYERMKKEVDEAEIIRKKAIHSAQRWTDDHFVARIQEHFLSLMFPERLHEFQITLTKINFQILHVHKQTDEFNIRGLETFAEIMKHERAQLRISREQALVARSFLNTFMDNIEVLIELKSELEHHIRNHVTLPVIISRSNKYATRINDGSRAAIILTRKGDVYTVFVEDTQNIIDFVDQAHDSAIDATFSLDHVLCLLKNHPFGWSPLHTDSIQVRTLPIPQVEFYPDSLDDQHLDYKITEENMKSSSPHPIQNHANFEYCEGITVDQSMFAMKAFLNEVRESNEYIYADAIATEERMLVAQQQLDKLSEKISHVKEELVAWKRILLEWSEGKHLADEPVRVPKTNHTDVFKVLQNIEPKLQQSQTVEDTYKSIRNKTYGVEEHISVAFKQVNTVLRMADHFQITKFTRHFQNIEAKITALKQKIARAKTIAKEIKGPVNFQSPGYISAVLPSKQLSSSMSIHLQVNIKPFDGDGLILTTGNDTRGFQIELKLIQSHLEIRAGVDEWSLHLRFPEPLESGNWYQLDIGRSGENVTAKIESKTKNLAPQTLNSKSSSTLSMSLASPLYVAGFPEEFKIAKQDDFDGCLDALKINDYEISLFASESFNGEREPCFAGS